MRKHLKSKILSMIDLVQEAHNQIKVYIDNNEFGEAMQLMSECQQSAIAIGNALDESEGEELKAVTLLEDYCESVYQCSCLISNKANKHKLFITLDDKLNYIKKFINDYTIHYEVLFLPYKSSMWDSLESIWISAKGDDNCSCYVVPIPYYYKNPDGSLGDLKYEGSLFPEYVDITHWHEFNIKEHKPDIIFIHNPYDNGNHVTSVHQDYYCKELKKYTEMLVYIPYFVGTNNIDANLCVNGGTLYSDRVIVQSEIIRKIYDQEFMKLIKEMHLENKINFNNQKFIALGSPKIDKVLATKKENIDIPDSWKSIIGSKKVILYNTTVNDLLEKSEEVINKLYYVFNCFKEYQNEITLLWRPHPLSNLTCYAMRPNIVERYIKLVEEYKAEGWGLYDDTPEVHRAIAITDAYLGDKGSLMPMYGVTGKPIMVQDYNYSVNRREYSSLWVEDILKDGDYIWFPAGNYNGLFRYNLINLKIEVMSWLPGDARNKRMYGNITRYKNLIILTPLYTDSIIIYHMESGKSESFLIKEPEIKSIRYNGIDKFFATLIYKQYVFFVGAAYPAIIRMNLESKEIDYFYEPFSELEKYATNTVGMNFRKEVVIIGNSAYLACRNSNIVMELNLDSCSSKIWRVGEQNNRYSGICYDGKCFWLPSYIDGTMIKWDINSGKTSKILLFAKSKKNINYFAGLFYHDEYVWIFPQTSNLIYKINIKSEKVQKVDLFHGFLNRPQYENMKGIIRYFFIKCIDDEIFAYSTLYNVIIRLNLLTNEIIINEMNAPKQIRDIGNIDNNQSSMHILWENEELTITQYLNIIASKDTLPDEKQISIFSQHFINASENSGQIIYQYLKNTIINETQ